MDDLLLWPLLTRHWTFEKKKCGKGRGDFLQKRSEECSIETTAYKKFLLRKSTKNEIQNLNGTNLLTAPVIHQMREFIADKHNMDADLKFLRSKPLVEYYGSDAASYTSSKNGSTKSLSLSSSSSIDTKEYENLCTSEDKNCEDNLGRKKKDIKANDCKCWDWKPRDDENAGFVLSPEEFPALK